MNTHFFGLFTGGLIGFGALGLNADALVPNFFGLGLFFEDIFEF